MKSKETLIERLASRGLVLTGKIIEITVSQAKIRVIVETDQGRLPVDFPVDALGDDYQIGRPKPNDKVWEQEGWLEKEYRREGGWQGISEKYDLDVGQATAMRRYARDTLRWRRSDGTIVQRWEFIARYFAVVGRKNRPSVRALSKALDINYTSAHHYKKLALEGDFFGDYLTHDRLEEMQSYLHKEEPYILFPKNEVQPSLRHFALLQAKGYPNLPAGLVSDLLTRLKPTFESATQRGREVTLSLRCHEEIVFTVELVEGNLWEAGQTGPFVVESVSEKLGVLRFSLGDAAFTGKASTVIRASSGAQYGSCLQDKQATASP